MKIKQFAVCAALMITIGRLAAEPAFNVTALAAAADTSADADGAGSTTDNDGKKHYLIAAGGVLTFTYLLSSYNRYVTKSGWAEVTWDYASHFYEHDMEFDNDWYWTNFVLHPYQGSISYMMARGSNLNKFESFLYSVAGSTIWEYFCETNAPSTNDMIYTPIGGFIFGEMLYKLSLEAEEVNKLFGFIINPTRLWTQPLVGHPLGETGHIHALSLKLGAGTQKQYTTFSGNGSPSGMSEFFPVFVYPEFNVVYNDPYGWDSNDPLEQFDLTGHGGFGAGSNKKNGGGEKIFYDVKIQANGMLWSRELDHATNKDTTIGIIFDYDFIWQSSMELSSLAPGFAYKQRIRLADNAKIEWQFHQGWVTLGTSDYYYYMHKLVDYGDTWREFNYNTGSKTQFIWSHTASNGNVLSTNLSLFALWDFPAQKQDYGYAGWELIGFINADYEVAVSERVHLGLANELYLKKAFFDGTADLLQTVYTGSVFVRLIGK